jgi:hypothetical protein
LCCDAGGSESTLSGSFVMTTLPPTFTAYVPLPMSRTWPSSMLSGSMFALPDAYASVARAFAPPPPPPEESAGLSSSFLPIPSRPISQLMNF